LIYKDIFFVLKSFFEFLLILELFVSLNACKGMEEVKNILRNKRNKAKNTSTNITFATIHRCVPKS